MHTLGTLRQPTRFWQYSLRLTQSGSGRQPKGTLCLALGRFRFRKRRLTSAPFVPGLRRLLTLGLFGPFGYAKQAWSAVIPGLGSIAQLAARFDVRMVAPVSNHLFGLRLASSLSENKRRFQPSPPGPLVFADISTDKSARRSQFSWCRNEGSLLHLCPNARL